MLDNRSHYVKIELLTVHERHLQGAKLEYHRIKGGLCP